METHQECEPGQFCLWPLHPGPCASRRARQARTAPPGSGSGRARVPAPAPHRPPAGRAQVPPRAPAQGRAAPPAPNRPASGRARVGGPPAPVPPPRKGAKKAPPRKAAPAPDETQVRPAAGNDETQARPRQRSVASDAGGAALMMMGGVAGRDRAAETVMRDVRRAVAQDARDGGTANQDAAIERAANVVARSVALHYGGGPEVHAKVVAAMTEAMKTGDTSKITALKRQLQGIHASAAPERVALALFGLAIVDQVEMWGGVMPAFSSPASNMAHVECNLSVFCRNPLHPGPCKGWKGTLAKVAPGTLKLIEEERKKKLAAKKAAKLAAQAKASKIVDKAKRGTEVDEHPNAKKKLAKKATEQILGTDEAKIAEIEGKTKLTQKEMAWHANKKAAALLAANIAAGNLQSKAAQAKYRQTVRAEILAALKADNESGLTGSDSEYQKVINGWSQALSNGHADQHVKPKNDAGDALHSAVADAFHAAVLEDVKNAKTGHQGVNMKKLTKALKEIPGEPGEPEHDAAVGEAVGHSVTPEELNGGPVLPPGALGEEEANQLAAGAAQMLGVTSTSGQDDAANFQKVEGVKAKAMAEGFKDKQAAMVAKTAENQAALAAAQHADGLDGFSPQGKKKFEKLLAAEFVQMMETGEGSEPGSETLADLIMQKKTGMITADEFHEKVQKKLKIKSKKQTAVQAPSAPAAGPAGGGAGAGGLTKAQASSAAADEIQAEIGGGDSLDLDLALSNSSMSEAEKSNVISAVAGGLAQDLMNSLPTDSLTKNEKEELHGIVKSMVQAAIQDPQHAPGAKNMIKNLKKKNGPELKAFAKGILPPAKADEDAAAADPDFTPGGATSGAPAKALPKLFDLGNNKSASAKQMAEDAANGNVGNEQVADYLTPNVIADANEGYYDLGIDESQALDKKVKALIKEALETGDTSKVEAYKKKIAALDTLELAEEALSPDPDVTPGGGSGGWSPKPLASITDSTQAAATIAVQAQAAYEKLLPEADGSALSTVSAIAKLKQSIDNGQAPEAAAASAATALAKAFLKSKIGTSKMQPLHEAALQDALANEIYEGMLTGKFPEGGHLDKLGGSKFGFVKMKIAAKKEYDKTGGLPSGPVTKTAAPIKVTSSKQDALDAALDDAFGPTTPAAPSGPPPTPSDKLVKFAQVQPGAAAGLVAKAVQDYEQAMAAAKTDEEKQAAALSLGGSLAGAQLGHMFNELDLSLGDMDPKQLADVANKLKADFADAVAADAEAPGGLAGKLPGIIAEVQKQADLAQKANGFADGSPALNNYKQALVEAELDQAINDTTPIVMNAKGGAGAGGTGTGVNPATAATGTPIKVTTGVQDVTPPTPATAAPKAPGLKPLPPAGPAPDLSGAKKVGEQGGSNPGGMYEDASGKRHYVKQQKSQKHAQNEAMASALYRAAGVDTPPVHQIDGTVGNLSGSLTASEIVPGAQKFDPKNPAHVAAVRRGFAVDAWLGNWDVAGLSMDNIIIGADGRPHRIDLGGSLEFRAQGSPKGNAFGDTVGEIDTLRDPAKNPSAAKIFGGMTDEEMIDAMEQVEAIDPAKIREIVKAQGGDPALAEKLIKRREDILKQLADLREAQKNKGPLGTPSTAKAETVKLGGTKKKQTVFKPKGGYPVSQVVLEGHENAVLDYNNRVEASRHSVDAADPPTAQMTAMPAGAPKTALKYYTSNAGYTAMNGHLRKNKGKSGTTGAAKSIADADKAFEQSRLPEPITTLRGVRGNADVFGALWTQRRDQNWTGAEFLDHGYSSSSVQMSTARGFAGAPGPNAVVMRVYMPTGTRAINLGQGSQYPGEAEILLNRGARFRIVADNGYQNGARHIDVEVICDGEGCADAV